MADVAVFMDAFGVPLAMAMKQFGGSSGAMGLADMEAELEPEQANEQAMVMIRAMIYAA